MREPAIAFGDEHVKKAYESLKEGAFQDKELYNAISKAIDDLKNDPFCGINLSKKLIPKVYIQKYAADNLWKYNLPKAWRLLYTVKGGELIILSVLLEWMSHKDYERRFGYG